MSLLTGDPRALRHLKQDFYDTLLGLLLSSGLGAKIRRQESADYESMELLLVLGNGSG